MRRVVSHLTFQVLVAIIIGVLVGMNFPAFAPTAKLISQTFINMISMLIAPIIFFTIVLGIAQMGDMKKSGRLCSSSEIYGMSMFSNGIKPSAKTRDKNYCYVRVFVGF